MSTKKEASQIDWHSGFAGGLNLSLRDYAAQVEIEREVQLNKKPLRMDALVVKKNDDVYIDNALGRGFKKYNIIEYKNPKDELNIDVVWKTIGYAGIYKSLGRRVNEIPAEEITVTIVRYSKPVHLFKLIDNNHGKVISEQAGIYRLENIICIPVRVLVLKEISDPKLLALKIMKENADEEDVRAFVSEITKYNTPGDKQDADAVMQVSASARHLLMKMRD